MIASSFQTTTTSSFTPSSTQEAGEYDVSNDWLNEETRAILNSSKQNIAELWKPKLPCRDAYRQICDTISLLKSTQSAIYTLHDDTQRQRITPTLHALFTQSVVVGISAYKPTLSLVFFAFGLRVRGLKENPANQVDGVPQSRTQAQREHFQLFHDLGEVGLAGPYAQEAFAHAIDRLLTELVSQKFGSNEKRSSIIDELKQLAAKDFYNHVACFWGDEDPPTEDTYYLYRSLQGQAPITLTSDDYVSRAVQKLGKLRTANLYNTIETLSTAPLQCGALIDMTHYLATPSARQVVCEAFSSHLRRHLLHQARSTVSILDTYVRIIGVFKAIDPSGIVLFRVAEPIKAFLRNRDDAVRVILSSLLDGSQDAQGHTKPSSEAFSAPVARCMDDEDQGGMSGEWHEAMDYQNLNWQPEPTDAAVGHQAVRNLSAMAHLVTLSPADAFIKELQNVLCERLLQPQQQQQQQQQSYDSAKLPSSSTPTTTTPRQPPTQQEFARSFDREIRLLNLFTLRFAEYHIQSLEVMLQDVLASQKLNSIIEQRLRSNSSSHPASQLQQHQQQRQFQSPKTPPAPSARSRPRRHAQSPSTPTSTTTKLPQPTEPTLNATLLSLSYWPSSLTLSTSNPLTNFTSSTSSNTSSTINPPPSIEPLLTRFSTHYTALKPHRRLEWLHTLGTATVTLDFEDRSLKVQCSTWQASVIDAVGRLIGDNDSSSSSSSSKKPNTKAEQAAKSITAQQITQETGLPPDLVDSACHFWMTQRVLSRSSSSSTYTILERLPTSSTSTSSSSHAMHHPPEPTPPPPPPPTTTTDPLTLNLPIYSTFTIGMLTNQGAMPAGRILAMLKMAVPGGFPFGEGELVESVLEGLVAQGRVRREGGVWRVVR